MKETVVPVITLGTVVLVIGLVLRYGQSSSNLAYTAANFGVNETKALSLANVKNTQTVTPVYSSSGPA